MKKELIVLKLVIISLSFLLFLGGIMYAVTPLKGDWQGVLNINGLELAITIHFKDHLDNLRATIDIPLQGVKNYSLQKIKVKGQEIYMELPSQIIGEFKGYVNNNKISGQYSQGMDSGTFHLQKIKIGQNEENNNNIKELTQEEVSVKVDDGTLYGTLQWPEGKHLLESTKHPIALIIAGSGPTDRNGNSVLTGENNSLKMLAEGLAKAGIATLRYDKRMVAESSAFNISERELRFNDYINDAVTWIDKLKNDSRFSEIYVIGHSQGSLVAMVAVRKAKADGFISIAGPGQTIDQTFKKQVSSLEIELKQETYRILDSLKSGETVLNIDYRLNSLFRPSIQPFLISYMRFDPQREIGKLSVPVLIIQGTTDMQVSTEDAESLKWANKKAKLVIIEGMNHVLKESSRELDENIATYNRPDLFLAPGLIEEISKFIKG